MILGYLACPYTHRERHVMHARYVQIAMIGAELIKAGYWFYCPIVHTHPIAHYGGMPLDDHEIWLPFDRPMMERCDELWIVMMDGWKESRGIQHEITIFQEMGKPIKYLEPDQASRQDSMGASDDVMEFPGAGPGMSSTHRSNSSRPIPMTSHLLAWLILLTTIALGAAVVVIIIPGGVFG